MTDAKSRRRRAGNRSDANRPTAITQAPPPPSPVTGSGRTQPRYTYDEVPEPRWSEYLAVGHVTVWEFTALSLRRDPIDLLRLVDRHEFRPPPLFQRRFELLKRAIQAGQLKVASVADNDEVLIALPDCVAWATRAGWADDLPLELASDSTRNPSSRERYADADVAKAKRALEDLRKNEQPISARAIENRSGVARQKIAAMVKAGVLPADAMKRAGARQKKPKQ